MAFIDDLRTIRDNMTAALNTLSTDINRGPASKDGINWPAYRDHLLKSILEMDQRILELELRTAVEIRELGVA